MVLGQAVATSDHDDHVHKAHPGVVAALSDVPSATGYEFHGSRWNGNTFGVAGGQVTWGFTGDFGGVITQHLYRKAVSEAFGSWENVADIDFVFVENAASADVRVGWSTLDDNGPGDIIGLTTWTYLPSDNALDEILEAQVEFDLADFPAAPGDVALADTLFYATAVLEIGHVVGLAHVHVSGEIMNGVVSAGAGALGSGDITGAQLIYGAAVNVPAPVPEPVQLLGTAEDDLLLGEAGDDIILMRYGNDIAAGGGGADLFILDTTILRLDMT